MNEIEAIRKRWHPLINNWAGNLSEFERTHAGAAKDIATLLRLHDAREHVPDVDGVSMRAIFVQLLREVPPDTVVWRSMSGPFTAEKLIQDFLERGELGQQYAADFLRIARDLLTRKAELKGEKA